MTVSVVAFAVTFTLAGTKASTQRRERREPVETIDGSAARERAAAGFGGPGVQRGGVEAARAAAAQRERVADAAARASPTGAGDAGELVEQERQRRFGGRGERAEAGERDERDVGAGGGPREHFEPARADARVHGAAPGADAGPGAPTKTSSPALGARARRPRAGSPRRRPTAAR